jgi:hypothetical protein
MQNVDITNGHMFPHKVEVDLDMLHALVLNRVGREVDDADVITVYEGVLCQRSKELLQASTTPLATTQYSASALE